MRLTNCLQSLCKGRVIQTVMESLKSSYNENFSPLFHYSNFAVRWKCTLFAINVMLLWLLGWAASRARAVSDHGGVTSDAWSHRSDSPRPQRRPCVLFSGVASVPCPVRKHKLVSSLVKCLHFSIIIHRRVLPLDINVLCTENLVHAYDALSFCFLSV